MKFERVAVGIDFTAAGLAAIQHAVGIAGAGALELVHVLSADQLPRVPFVEREVVDRMVEGFETEAKTTLGQLARELEANGTRVTTSVCAGRPADELVRAAQSADLLVVGAHSRSILDRLALGSVTEEVVRRSRTPVLVVREHGEGSTKITRVLVAVDLLDPCVEVLEVAANLGRRLGASVEAVHVVPWPGAITSRLLNRVPGELESRARDEATKAVRALVAPTLGENAPVHVAFGSPAAEVVTLARPGDLIVSGTHGRGTFGRLAFGSVATKVLRTAPCPVLVVRPAAGAVPRP